MAINEETIKNSGYDKNGNFKMIWAGDTCVTPRGTYSIRGNDLYHRGVLVGKGYKDLGSLKRAARNHYNTKAE